MSIAPLCHATLIGLLADKERVLADLQDLGVVHLVHTAEPGHSAPLAPPRSKRALRFLTGARHRWHQSHDRARFDPAAVEARALELEARARALAEERDALLHRIKQLAPWGDFEFPENPPPEVRFWFYIVPNHRLRAMPREACWQVVHRDHRFSYVVVIAPNEPSGIPAARTHAGARALSALRSRLEAVYIELDELEGERAREARWCDLLANSLDRLADDAALRSALGATTDEAPLFQLTAWVPIASLDRVRALAQRRALAFAFRAPLPDERPPTLLENRGVAEFGQDILGFYLVPAYGAWDPSRSIFWFFAVFFAVIVADAGYAALLGLGLALSWRALGTHPLRRRARRFLCVAVAGSHAFGVAVGSYFGVAPPASSLAASLVLFGATDIDAYLTLAILLGAIQLGIANAALARHGRGPAAVARIGWMAIIAGALWSWLADAPATDLARNPGAWAMVVGAVAVAAFSSSRRSRLARAADGALALTRAVGLFSDTLSYLRLFALGFAGASLAAAFNDLAANIASAVPGVGLLFAAVVLLLGHGANLGLAVASGVVHGLRLNLIEFLNWSVEAEGTPFRRFARKEHETWSTR